MSMPADYVSCGTRQIGIDEKAHGYESAGKG
jgi:hypothetical protein